MTPEEQITDPRTYGLDPADVKAKMGFSFVIFAMDKNSVCVPMFDPTQTDAGLLEVLAITTARMAATNCPEGFEKTLDDISQEAMAIKVAKVEIDCREANNEKPSRELRYIVYDPATKTLVSGLAFIDKEAAENVANALGKAIVLPVVVPVV